MSQKFSQMPAATTPFSGNELFCVSQTGVSKQSTLNELVAYIGNEGVVFSEMHFQGNPFGTTINSIGVPEKVNATYLQGNTSPDFTFTNGELTYAGTGDITVLIQANLTASMALTTATVTPGIALNGTVLTQSQQSTSLVGVSPAYESMSVSAIVTLSTNDTLTLVIANETDTNEVFVQDLKSRT